jgi:hypothetical protein
MKLTEENIKFIDNYLKNSEVEYFDIRMEMLDHISSAVEEKMQLENLDFYDAFKNYMTVNKKAILKNNPHKFKLLKTTFKNYFLFLFTFQSILAFVCVYAFFETINSCFQTKDIHYYGSMIVFFSVFIGFLYYHFKLKEQLIRFSSLESVTGLIFLFYQFSIFFNNGGSFKEQTSLWFLISYISAFIIFFLFYKRELKKVKNSQLYKSLK